MRDMMDLERFEALVAAYGATPNRWPEEERAAAEAFAKGDPRAATLLAGADSVDAMLFAHRVAEPSRTLRRMVLESAPKRRRLTGRARLWWSALALTLAAGSGALAGSAATAALDPVTAHAQIYERDELNAYEDVIEENAS